MAQVKVDINGKIYKISCEEGQEERLADLAARFGRYVSRLHEQFGNIGDLRLAVMAGVMIMDDMTEISHRLEKTQTELDTLRNSFNNKLLINRQKEEALVEALQDIATRIRDLAVRLNNNTRINSAKINKQLESNKDHVYTVICGLPLTIGVIESLGP